MKRLAWLGILATLGALVYLGYTRKLPNPMQRYADKVGSWVEARGVDKAVDDIRSRLGFPDDHGADDRAGPTATSTDAPARLSCSTTPSVCCRVSSSELS